MKNKIQSDRITLNQNANTDNSINVSFSSNNSYYEKIDNDIKKDKRFLYNKKSYLLKRPSNKQEEIALFQHTFYSSTNLSDSCKICGESKIKHINESNQAIIYSNNSSFNILPIKSEIIKIQKKKELKFKCKICEEVLDKNLISQCEKCYNYFCNECLYLHIKELIKNGKSELFCPQCNTKFNKDKIEEIFVNNNGNKNEIENFKKFLENNNTKNIILSNENLMFCPIIDCQGYAKKNIDNNYNICNKGHEFCSKCGNLWHQNDNCPEEKNDDKLFQQYCKKSNLKKCPYCKIVTSKKKGCNHVTCTFCKKNWCWLCQELFESTDEHYGNQNNKCYGAMMNIASGIFCSKCGVVTNSYKTFSKCEHLICKSCLKKYFLENDTLILNRKTKMKCMVEGCNNISQFSGENIIDFIKEINNDHINNKYRKQILFFKYNFTDYFANLIYQNMFEDYWSHLLINIYLKVGNYFETKYKDSKGYIFLQMIGYLFAITFMILYMMIIPISFCLTIKKIYYKYFKETIKQYNYRLVFIIMAGEELLFLIFLFPFLYIHYIYTPFIFIYLILYVIISGILYLIEICKK